MIAPKGSISADRRISWGSRARGDSLMGSNSGTALSDVDDGLTDFAVIEGSDAVNDTSNERESTPSLILTSRFPVFSGGDFCKNTAMIHIERVLVETQTTQRQSVWDRAHFQKMWMSMDSLMFDPFSSHI